MLNTPVNNFSVMLGRSHCFLVITNTFGVCNYDGFSGQFFNCLLLLCDLVHDVETMHGLLIIASGNLF